MQLTYDKLCNDKEAHSENSVLARDTGFSESVVKDYVRAAEHEMVLRWDGGTVNTVRAGVALVTGWTAMPLRVAYGPLDLR